MTMPIKHHTKIWQSRSFFIGLLMVAILAISPVLAQARILQETFGQGYGFLQSPTATNPLKTRKMVKSSTQNSTFRQTFGDGYALQNQKPSRVTIGTKTQTKVDRKIKNLEILGKEPRISAFHSLMADGYGAVGHSLQLSF